MSTPPDPHTHETSDGRVLTLAEMTTPHLFATVASLTKWMKDEPDSGLKAELQRDIRLLWAELRSRKKSRKANPTPQE